MLLLRRDLLLLVAFGVVALACTQSPPTLSDVRALTQYGFGVWTDEPTKPSEPGVFHADGEERLCLAFGPGRGPCFGLILIRAFQEDSRSELLGEIEYGTYLIAAECRSSDEGASLDGDRRRLRSRFRAALGVVAANDGAIDPFVADYTRALDASIEGRALKEVSRAQLEARVGAPAHAVMMVDTKERQYYLGLFRDEASAKRAEKRAREMLGLGG